MHSRFGKRGFQCLAETMSMTMALGGATSKYNFSNGIRVESDSMGNIDVPGDKLWGVQTQR